jgi:pimeloyl-ACP methyl ester carboxylesterase
MRLSVRSWGTGPRTALLVHGFSDDSSTWWRVGPALAELGWTVLAPDLRGHGASPRAMGYRLEEFADDLVETLTAEGGPRLGLALGHSLGAATLGLAVERLQPERSVFVDPPWFLQLTDDVLQRELAAGAGDLPPHTAAWSPEDVAVELASNGRVDPAVAPALGGVLSAGPLAPPAPARARSTVLVPELDPVLPCVAHPLLAELGYAVATQPGVRHVMHRDDPDGFFRLLLSQLAEDELVA